MLTFIVRRALILLATLLVASAAIFVVLEVLQGDPALLILGLEAQDDTLAALRAQMGLDRPPLERYLGWIAGMAVGQTGISHTYAVPVGELIAARLEVTIPLALLAFVASSLLAVPLGMFAATRRNRPGDYGVMTFSQIAMAIPNFWFGILLIMLFAVVLDWFPAGRRGWERACGRWCCRSPRWPCRKPRSWHG